MTSQSKYTGSGRLISLDRFPYLAALRPKQWTKNFVIFAAPLFAFDLRVSTILGSLLAFALFCSVSSSFYLFNDIVDVESDRRHPVKCKRPIASGKVSIPIAIAMALALMTGGLIIGWMHAAPLGMTLSGYVVLQIAYNLRLKRTVILDVIAIAMGFVLRACAGAAATGIQLSPWFLTCTAMLALFLAVEKRKAELRLLQVHGGKTRAVLWRYSLPLLTRMENVVTTGAIMSYALWSSGPAVNGASTPWMLVTFPFVLYGVFRYQLLSDPKEIGHHVDDEHGPGGQTERPDEVLLRDMPILGTVVCWVVTIFAILYLQSIGQIN
ncbi:MAG: decaprenyl-phosphate phosphoribosyltransferase [Cyanobacteria bacterium J06633_2]